MYFQNEHIGVALRSKKNCNPIYISPGNNINIQQSVDVIKNCIRGYRIPEPTRQAHLLVNKIRIEDGDKTTQLGLFD
jgi:deoxyribonuclease V